MPEPQPEAGPSHQPDDSMDLSTSSSQQSVPLPSLPPQPIPEPSEDYGRRFTALLEALELTVRKGTNKFSYEDFQLAFPLQCMLNPKECREVWLQVGEELRTRVLAVAEQKLEEANTKAGLRSVQEAVIQAQERNIAGDGSYHGDEWILSSELSPAALTAAHNLPLHDAEWNRLQKELIELDSDISTLYASLKQTEDERAKELSVYRLMMEQIDQSVATLRRLPVDELTHWMELNLGKESISS